MSLVDYSDGLVDYSDSEDDAPPLKRKRSLPPTVTAPPPLPPLPDTFHNCYVSATRLSSQDDPALHGGRQRQTPHVEGNWPTHVYLEYEGSCWNGGFPSPGDSTRLQDIMTRVVAGQQDNDKVHTLLNSDLGTDLPLHISLSCPLVLHAEQRHGFMSALTRRISESDVAPFTIHPSTLSWHPNANSTRHFLVLGGLQQRDPRSNDHHHHQQKGLSRLLQASNATASEYGQPTLYTTVTPTAKSTSTSLATKKHPLHKTHRIAGKQRPHGEDELDDNTKSMIAAQKSHISIAWALESPPALPPPPSLSSSLEKDNEEVQTTGGETESALHFAISVKEVKVKMGNLVTMIPLSASVSERASSGRERERGGIVEH